MNKMMNKKIKTIIFSLISPIILALPMLFVIIFISKLSELSCITVTNKMYMMLGCIAIIIYWWFKYMNIGASNAS